MTALFDTYDSTFESQRLLSSKPEVEHGQLSRSHTLKCEVALNFLRNIPLHSLQERVRGPRAKQYLAANLIEISESDAYDNVLSTQDKSPQYQVSISSPSCSTQDQSVDIVQLRQRHSTNSTNNIFSSETDTLNGTVAIARQNDNYDSFDEESQGKVGPQKDTKQHLSKITGRGPKASDLNISDVDRKIIKSDTDVILNRRQRRQYQQSKKKVSLRRHLSYAENFLLLLDLGAAPQTNWVNPALTAQNRWGLAKNSSENDLQNSTGYSSMPDQSQEEGLLSQGILQGRLFLSNLRSDVLVASYLCDEQQRSGGNRSNRKNDTIISQIFGSNSDRVEEIFRKIIFMLTCGYRLQRVIGKNNVQRLRDKNQYHQSGQGNPTSTQKIKGVSYARYLQPQTVQNQSVTTNLNLSYDPWYLDDPRLRQGKHHCVLRLESFQMSVVPLIRPQALKEELNEQFRILHPWASAKRLTLSKLRNLRKDLLSMTDSLKDVNLDMSTIAIAWVYFEKLVLNQHVDKSNRKLMAAACLVLAFKFNHEAINSRVFLRDLKQIHLAIRRMDRKDRLNIGDVRKAEWQAFTHLGFCLHIIPDHALSHLSRLLELKELDFAQYYSQ